jgi:hypothetical protein
VILHYIWAGFQALGGLMGLAFVGMGTYLSLSPQILGANTAPPPWFGAVFAGVGMFVLVTVEALAVLSFLTGRFLSRRQHHTFCIVISAINCLTVPFGTALGVYTIVVLLRPSVKQLFSAAPPPPPLPNMQSG